MSCEERQIALEKGTPATSLSAHLESCTDCRAYERSRMRMLAGVRNRNSDLDSAQAWKRVRPYVLSRERREHRLLHRNLPLGIALSTLVLGLALATGSGWVSLFSAGFLVAALLQLAYRLHRRRTLRRLAGTAEDLLATARRELAIRVTLSWLGAWTAAFLGVAWTAGGMGAPMRRWLPAAPSGSAWFQLVAGAVFFAWSLFVLARVLPPQRRELERYQ